MSFSMAEMSPSRGAMMSAEQELACIHAYQQNKCPQALGQILTSFEKYLAKRAGAYARRTGMDMDDLMQEARLGLIRAVEKFEDDKGARLATYASWWVAVAIREYVEANRSIQKTPSRMSLTNRKAVDRYNELLDTRKISPDVKPFTTEEQEWIIEQTGMTAGDIQMLLKSHYAASVSLDAPLKNSEGQEGASHMDMLTSEVPGPSEAMERASDVKYFYHIFTQTRLTDREREIITQRHLQEDGDKATLEDLSQVFGVSRERIRQIEAKALEKLGKKAREVAGGFAARSDYDPKFV